MGTVGSPAIAELGRASGSVSTLRVVSLTMLARKQVEAILDGRQGSDVALLRVLEPFRLEWEHQRANFRLTT